MQAPHAVIGHPGSDHLGVQVLSRTHPGATDYWDGNWVRCRVSVRAHPFEGTFIGDLRTDELERLHEDLTALYQDLRGELHFENMDGHLTFNITGDGRGHFSLEGIVQSDPSAGQRLSFRLLFDQTDIPPIVADLATVLQSFPVRGEAPEGGSR